MLFKVSPSKAKEALVSCFKAGLVPFLRSSPGVGKSSLVKEIADEWNLELIDIRLSSIEPIDLQGLPQFDLDGYAVFRPYKMFPIEGTNPPEGKDGWILFLDELNSAPRAVIAAAYKLVLDRMLGQHKLSDRCLIACAGNLDSDNAITNRMGTAMMSRVVNLEMESSFEDWLNNVAIPNNYDTRLIAYLNMYPNKLMMFNPDKEGTFPCPRTWQFVQQLIKDEPELRNSSTDFTPLIAGCIGDEIASEFVQFTAVFKNLVSVQDVVLNNGQCSVPEDQATKWAVVSSLMANLDKSNATPICNYIAKFDMTFQILFLRYMLKKFPDVAVANSVVRKQIAEIGKYLND